MIKNVAESDKQQIKLKEKLKSCKLKKSLKKLLTHVKSSDILSESLEGDRIVTV